MKYIRRSDGSLFLVQNVRKVTERRPAPDKDYTFFSLTVGGEKDNCISWSFFTASERDRCVEEIEFFLNGEGIILDEAELYEASLAKPIKESQPDSANSPVAVGLTQ